MLNSRIQELREAFFSLKFKKSPGYDKFSELCEPLKHLFNLSIETGVFPDKLKTYRVSPVY